ncbi:PAS domain S-box protein [Thermodesulfobacteriota bacterium]
MISVNAEDILTADYQKLLYRRHFQGALIRTGCSLAMWLFALAAYFTGVIGSETLAWVSMAVLYLILINPPMLLVIKRISRRRTYRYFSLFINLLEIFGYTSVIYFSGGIEASFLTLMYAALIIYVGVTSPRRLPFIVAFLCVLCFSLMLFMEHWALIPHQDAFAHHYIPWSSQLLALSLIAGLLFVVAFISSYTATLLKKNRDGLRNRNLELEEKAALLARTQRELEAAREGLERRIQERTGELETMNIELKNEISERRQTENALRESESKYRDIFENVSDLLYYHDLEGNFIETNMPFKTQYGFTEEDLSQMRVWDLLPERYKAQFDVYLKQVITEGKSEGLMRIVSKPGREHIIEYKNSLVYEGETPVGIRGSARDITERYKAEKALEQASERFQQVAENAEEWIWEVDAKGLYTYASPVVEKILGYRPEEIIGKIHFYEHIHPEEREIAKKRGMEAFIHKEPRIEFVHRNIHKDGSTVWLLSSAVPILDKAGSVIGHRGAVTNITESKKAEETLLESEKKFRELYNESKKAEEVYRSLLHTSADAIVIYDLEGKAQYINPSFTQIFGWTLGEVVGRKIPFLPESEREGSMAAIREIIEKGRPMPNFETKRLTRDGRLIDVNLSGSRFDDHEGKPAGILSVLRDTSDRKKLENQLRHAQKMEAIGTMASGIAHNFRNILTVIQMNSHIIKSHYKGDNQLQAIVDVVTNYISRGAQLVEGMMQFSRQQATLESAPVNLSEIIKETFDFLQKSFDETIKLEMDVPDALHIVGDASGLSQVFMNLCGNARDAMPRGGKLHCIVRQDGEQAVVTIADTGQGMDGQTAEKCFDPFFTTKEVNKGTGLGLSTAYGIVKDHDGDIQVSSEVGKGTTFRLTFPLVAPEKKNDVEIPHMKRADQGQRVLLADDEIEICKVMAELLERSGYSVSYVHNGREALEKYKSWKPDIVLLDRSMPGMDGMTCAGEILASDPQARIVIISGYDETGPSGISAQDQKRIKGYLTKPIDLEEITLFLERVLSES